MPYDFPMRRFLASTVAALALIAGSSFVAAPAQADNSSFVYTVTADDPMSNEWASYLLDCAYFSNWTNGSRNAVEQTASVSVSGTYNFQDLMAPGDGYIVVLQSSYDPTDVTNCLVAIDEYGSVDLDAGKPYTLLLAGKDGSLGTFAYSVSGPGLLSVPARASSSVTGSASATAVTVGETINLNAGIASANTGADLSGMVEFFAGTVSLGTGNVNAGSAMLSSVVLPEGTHSITAVYSGNDGTFGSVSEAIEVTVAPAAIEPEKPSPTTPTPPKRVETGSR